MNKALKSGILLVCAICLSVTTSAQIKGVIIGDSVRVTAQSLYYREITGVVTNMTGEFISISGKDQLEIPIETIQKLEIQKEVRNTGRGALIGAGVSGAIGGIIAVAGNESCEPDEWCVLEFSDGEAFLMGTAVGLLPGALVGAIIGANTKRTKWKNVPLDLKAEPISLGYLNEPPTPGITLRWSF